MPAAPIALDQIDLDVRPKPAWIPAAGLLLLASATSFAAAIGAGAWGGALLALLVGQLGVVGLHLAVTARLGVHGSLLAVRSRWRQRAIRLDELTKVSMWRGRLGEPHLVVADRSGVRVSLSPWFWAEGTKIEAVLGVALAEHDDIEVTNRLANRLDDQACLHFG